MTIRLDLVLWGWGCLLVVCDSRLLAESRTIVASRDNTIYSESTNSSGSAYTFAAGKTNNGAVRRGLLWFDVAGQVPAGAVITAASVTLHLDGAGQSETAARDGSLHTVTQVWGEGASGGGANAVGTGSAPTTNDATWTHRLFDTQNWSTPGGDFVATPAATTSIGTATGYYSFASNAALIADSQGWLDAPLTNHGWIVRVDESRNGTARRFQTHEAVNAEFRPYLQLEYQVIPEPTSGALLGIAGLGLLAGRRRQPGSREVSCQR